MTLASQINSSTALMATTLDGWSRDNASWFKCQVGTRAVGLIVFEALAGVGALYHLVAIVVSALTLSRSGVIDHGQRLGGACLLSLKAFTHVIHLNRIAKHLKHENGHLFSQPKTWLEGVREWVGALPKKKILMGLAVVSGILLVRAVWQRKNFEYNCSLLHGATSSNWGALQCKGEVQIQGYWSWVSYCFISPEGQTCLKELPDNLNFVGSGASRFENVQSLVKRFLDHYSTARFVVDDSQRSILVSSGSSMVQKQIPS